jgi:signal transduction histidine kinase
MDRSLAFEESAPAVGVQTDIPYSYLHHRLEAEKVRLSRDLHDELGQNLTVLKMGIAQIMRTNPRDARLKHQCVPLMDTVDKMIESVQHFCSELHPPVLEHLGFFEALESYIENFQRQTGLRCRWRRTREEPNVSSDRATQMFRIVQEALTNVARHAEAKRIVVETACSNNELSITIGDDGKGISVDKASDRRAIGLTNMRERARLIGGRLHISGSPGRGTVVRLTIPLSCCSAGLDTPQNREFVRKINDALAEQLRIITRNNAIHQEIRDLKMNLWMKQKQGSGERPKEPHAHETARRSARS